MKIPKYQRLVNELESAISDRRYPPGTKLPSVREMMGMHCLSLTTVTTAFAVLEERGLIEPRARSGYFVKPPQAVSFHGPFQHEQGAGGGFHWWPDAELFPRERLRKLTATIVRRHPDLAIQSPVNCSPRLIRELAKRCAETGCFIYEADIMVTHGVTEALSVALRATTSPGDRVVLQAPVAPLYQALCDSLGLEPMPVDVRLPEGEMLAALEAVLGQPGAPRVLLLASNVHCPTGCVLSLEAKQEILRLAGEHGCVIIEDDSAGDLHFERARPLPIKAFDREGAVIYVMAATRIIAPGLQLGWIASGERWRDRIEQVKSISACAVDHLPQLVMAEFLAQGSHLPHLRKLGAALRQRANDFEETLLPALGPVRGLAGRLGGYSRFLWSPDVAFDKEVEEHCRERWPNLFTPDRPYLWFKAGGISVNTSFALDAAQRDSLRALGQHLNHHARTSPAQTGAGKDSV